MSSHSECDLWSFAAAIEALHIVYATTWYLASSIYRLLAVCRMSQMRRSTESSSQQMPAMDKPAKSQSQNAPSASSGATHVPSRAHKRKQASQSMDQE